MQSTFSPSLEPEQSCTQLGGMFNNISCQTPKFRTPTPEILCQSSRQSGAIFSKLLRVSESTWGARNRLVSLDPGIHSEVLAPGIHSEVHFAQSRNTFRGAPLLVAAHAGFASVGAKYNPLAPSFSVGGGQNSWTEGATPQRSRRCQRGQP